MSITYDLPFADYLALPSVHFSTLKMMDISPHHYRRAVTQGRADTQALRVGRAVHALTLTPDAADVVVYDGVRRGKTWEVFADEHADKTIITATEHAKVAGMRNAVHMNPTSRALLRAGRPEVTIEWTDSETGLACRCRADFFDTTIASSPRLVELKTTRAAYPRAFMREFARLGYHAQMAFYVEGIEAVTGARPIVKMIAVEKDAPYDVTVYDIPDEALEVGSRKIRGWLRAVADCTASGKWPNVNGDEAVKLVLPDWAMTDGLEDVDMGEDAEEVGYAG